MYQFLCKIQHNTNNLTKLITVIRLISTVISIYLSIIGLSTILSFVVFKIRYIIKISKWYIECIKKPTQSHKNCRKQQMECEYFTEFDTQMMFSVIHTRTCTTSFSSPTIAIFDFDFHYKGHRYPPPPPLFPTYKRHILDNWRTFCFA